MKKAFFAALALFLALFLCFGAAPAEDAGILGKPFPDFTVTDTEGNAFTLSEALEEHEAALINIWATWCPPCEAEMPFLNEAYEKYGDRVAFIALSAEEEDTPEKIEDYRLAHGIRFPMGRDEGCLAYQYLGKPGLPTTVIVDRFGNAVFVHTGSFINAGDVMRVIDAFLGDGYTETAPLDDIPRDSSTRAFPVFPARAIRVENEGAVGVLFYTKDDPASQPVWVVRDDVAHLRLEIPASDDPAVVTCYNMKAIRTLQELYDPERGAYFFDQPMPDADAGTHYVYICLAAEGDTGDYICGIYLIPDEKYIEELLEAMRSWGYDPSWEYGDPSFPEREAPEAFILHIADQYGGPVAGAIASFCTDTACAMVTSDENGLITFSGAPDVYHVQLLKLPEGWSFDPGFELTVGPDTGEWLVRVRKD